MLMLAPQLNSLIDGDADSVYLIVNDLGDASSRLGFDFVDGQAFLERFYAVYNVGASQFGIAETPFTFAESN